MRRRLQVERGPFGHPVHFALLWPQNRAVREPRLRQVDDLLVQVQQQTLTVLSRARRRFNVRDAGVLRDHHRMRLPHFALLVEVDLARDEDRELATDRRVGSVGFVEVAEFVEPPACDFYVEARNGTFGHVASNQNPLGVRDRRRDDQLTEALFVRRIERDDYNGGDMPDRLRGLVACQFVSGCVPDVEIERLGTDRHALVHVVQCNRRPGPSVAIVNDALEEARFACSCVADEDGLHGVWLVALWILHFAASLCLCVF